MSKDFPKMVYRADGAVIANRIVADAVAATQAETEGWGEYHEAQAALVATPAPVGATVDQSKELAAANADVASWQSKAERLRDASAADAAVNVAQAARIADLEGFLNTLAADEGCSEKLKAAIAELLAPPADAAKGKSKKAAKAAA